MVLENGVENLVVSGEKTMLWNHRLGHIAEKGLRILHGKGMVEGMRNSSLDFDFCENCVYGKHNRVSFPSSGKRTKHILELVHSDVFRPLKVPSLEKKIKVLRTDNGVEFCSKEFEEFYTKRDIAQQKTTPYTPQQNGVTERMNKTLMERARSMLSGVGYLRGTSDYGLCYQGRPRLDRVLDIRAFVDADWAGDLDQRRSTSGYVFNLFGGAVSCMSKKQYVLALSTIEVEYMAATHARKEAVSLQRLCSSMGLVQGAITIDCDSQSAIFLAKNPPYHSKTKRIDVQNHFVRDMIEDKKVLLVKVDTLKNTADALTKSVSSGKLSWCRETMGVPGLEK
eukprot:PITA_19758